MEPRLKQHNLGASLLLKENDLVILDWYPPSSGVNVVRAILDNENQLESAAYLIRPGQPQQFENLIRILETKQAEAIRRSLSLLSEVSAELETYEVESDFGPYEPADRRALRFWRDGRRSGGSLPNNQYFADMGVPTELQKNFVAAFKEVWDGIASELPRNMRDA